MVLLGALRTTAWYECKSAFDQDGYVFAVERHLDLTRVLGIPSSAAGTGYRSLVDGELPDGIEEDDLVKVK